MSAREIVFLIGSRRPAEVLERLRAEFDPRPRAPETEATTYLDTFDWRVHAEGASLALSSRGGRLVWSAADTEETLTATLRGGELAFVGDVAPGPLRERMDALLDVRRLFPIAEVERRTRLVDLTDREGKTVVRLAIRERSMRRPENGTAAGAWTDAPGLLVLRGLRGYEDAFGQAERLLRFGLELEEQEGGEFQEALRTLALVPRRWKPVRLTPAEPTDRAVRRVLSGFLDAIEANLPGTVADLDTEFLHDLRVAVRRSRAVLDELAKALPRAIVDHYGKELRWLGNVTGPVRDLDVFGLEVDRYAKLVDARPRRDLRPFLAALTRRREEARRRLVGELESERCRTFLANWREELTAEPDGARTTDAGRAPIGAVASRHLRRRLDKVLKRGREVTPDSDPAELHGLRIRTKKLRYVLEVFRDLYDRKAAKPILQDLKRMQTVLGEVNDLSVHAAYVEEVGRGEASALPPETLLAMGRLAARLEEHRGEVGQRFFERFERFRGKQRMRAFERILQGSADA